MPRSSKKGTISTILSRILMGEMGAMSMLKANELTLEEESTFRWMKSSHLKDRT